MEPYNQFFIHLSKPPLEIPNKPQSTCPKEIVITKIALNNLVDKLNAGKQDSEWNCTQLEISLKDRISVIEEATSGILRAIWDFFFNSLGRAKLLKESELLREALGSLYSSQNEEEEDNNPQILEPLQVDQQPRFNVGDLTIPAYKTSKNTPLKKNIYMTPHKKTGEHNPYRTPIKTPVRNEPPRSAQRRKSESQIDVTELNIPTAPPLDIPAAPPINISTVPAGVPAAPMFVLPKAPIVKVPAIPGLIQNPYETPQKVPNPPVIQGGNIPVAPPETPLAPPPTLLLPGSTPMSIKRRFSAPESNVYLEGEPQDKFLFLSGLNVNDMRKQLKEVKGALEVYKKFLDRLQIAVERDSLAYKKGLHEAESRENSARNETLKNYEVELQKFKAVNESDINGKIIYWYQVALDVRKTTYYSKAAFDEVNKTEKVPSEYLISKMSVKLEDKIKALRSAINASSLRISSLQNSIKEHDTAKSSFDPKYKISDVEAFFKHKQTKFNSLMIAYKQASEVKQVIKKENHDYAPNNKGEHELQVEQYRAFLGRNGFDSTYIFDIFIKDGQGVTRKKPT